MSKELVVATGRHETRVAILEDDQLVEVFHEREKEYSLAGSIHKGRVTRVLPGMQSAFVDIGLERDAFLYVSDFFEDNDEYDAVVSTAEEKVLKMEKGGAPTLPEEARAVTAPAEEAAVVAESVAPERIQSQPVRESKPVEGRPDQGRDQSRDQNRDQGRRGRRGRRRGGRGPGGIPESKYFTPGASQSSERHASTPADPRPGQTVEAEGPDSEFEPETDQRTARATESEAFERFVLPGESLAKYSAPDRGAAVEPALPVDHHLAGLAWSSHVAGAESARPDSPSAESAPELVAAAPATPVSAEPAMYAAPASAEREPEPVAVAAASNELDRPDLIPTAEAPSVTLSEEDEEMILAAAEAVAAIEEETLDEIATGVPLAEVEAEAEAEESGDMMAESAEDEDDAEVAGEGQPTAGEEGPEPARIPTSLTAQLREQGHRYPHRVSRRSRRRGGRNRGDRGEQGERGPKPVSPVAGAEAPPVVEVAVIESVAIETALGEIPVEIVAGEAVVAGIVEEKSPALREDRRPDRGRDRGRGRDRDRGGRDREAGREGAKEAGSKGRDSERPDRERPVLPSISDLLKEGQEIIVQISKEPLGQKGARITSHIALPGRFVVYMPTVDHAGVSRKIPSEEERHRLKRVLQTHRQGIPGGYICRTAAEGKSEEELKSDMHFLYNLWLDMRQKAEKKPAPVLLHHDLDLVQRILRDQLTTSFKTIWVDNEDHYESILRFVERFQPGLVGRVKLYTRANPIFDEFGITAELEKALRPKVWLKSGGYIVINQTEALVAIDINTGKYVGKSNRLEDTIVKINTDAIKEIVRQIRLRDLGGIIVVDFIDMDERKNRQKVMLALEDAMRVDRAPYKILQFNDFGLVAITRKRVKQSLERTLCAPCSYCEGAGYIKSPQTVITEILSEAQRLRKAVADQQGNLMLRVNPEVAKVLKSNQNSFLQEVEEILGKSVMVKSDPLLHQTKFDLA
jgi:ribonuclease G